MYHRMIRLPKLRKASHTNKLSSATVYKATKHNEPMLKSGVSGCAKKKSNVRYSSSNAHAMQYTMILRYSDALKSRPCRRANSQLISDEAPIITRTAPTVPEWFSFSGRSMPRSKEKHTQHAGNSSEY